MSCSTVLSQEEVARLIASAQNPMHLTMLMTLYATGLRRAERGALLVDLGFCANRKHIVA